MGGAGTFVPLLCLIGFFGATWTASKVSRVVVVPALLMEIGIGILLGPRVVQLVHPRYAICERRSFPECQAPENLEELVLERRALGAALGRVANMGYCPQEVYLLGASAQGLGRQNATIAATAANASQWNASNASNASESASISALPPEGEDADAGAERRRLARRAQAWDDRAPDFSAYGQCLQRSCEADLALQCQRTPGLFTLIGHAGVGLLVFENAMHFNVHHVRSVGLWGCAVAAVGSVVPLVTGLGLAMLYGSAFAPAALLAGTALVPSGVGLAQRLLRARGVAVVESSLEKVATTAAFLDNLLALLLYDVFFSLGGTFDGFRMVASPVIGSVLTLLALAAAVYVWPRVLQEALLPRIEARSASWAPKVPATEQFLFLLMMGMLVFCAWIMFLLGNFLWGCFIAGTSFACLSPEDGAPQLWNRQAKVLTTWMVRVFFACTVAFSIPVEVLFTGGSFWKGALMGLFPCILGKVVSASFLGEGRFVVGWAMVARAELAFFIAQTSANAGLMDQETFCIVLWALIWANAIVPFALRTAAVRHASANTSAVAAARELGIGEAKVCEEGTQEAAWMESLEGIDLEDIAATSAWKLEQQEDMEAATAEAAPPADVPRSGPGGLLCCLFFREAAVN